MKEIWINLELYFESYEFSNFRDFFRIFLIYFRFLSIKNNSKRAKRGYIFARDPHGCDVACKATWQSHADPRERLPGVDVTRVHIYIYS